MSSIYRSPVLFSRLATAALAAAAVLEGVQLAFALVGWFGVDAAAMAWAMSALAGMLVSAGALVLLAAFSWRVTENAHALDPDGQAPRSWLAALGWFLPFANLYLPFDALSTVWSCSAMNHPGESQGPDRRFELFWGAWVASLIAGRFVGGETVGFPEVVVAALGLVACAAGVAVVTRITRVQTEAAVHLKLA